MTSTPEPHAVGRHLLGPHVVGTRVVVRHLLPDGSATDVLGTCTSWGADTLVVDRDGHGPVEIALADVVTGKPVPPRPSVRHRDTPRSVELHTHVLWPGLVAEPLGEWVLRTAPAYDGRLRRRANATLAMGDPGRPLDRAATEVAAWHRRHDRTPMAMVLAGSDEEAGLLDAGWRDLGSGSAHCQVVGVARAVRACTALLRSRPTSTQDAVVVESPGGGARGEEGGEEGGALVVDVGGGAATGRATLDDDWVVLDAVAVDPGHRRQGLATRVLAELLDWAGSEGARTAVLQVETDNRAAVRLYERLGFVTHHTYRYLVTD